jgi:hypothetical protein
MARKLLFLRFRNIGVRQTSILANADLTPCPNSNIYIVAWTHWRYGPPRKPPSIRLCICREDPAIGFVAARVRKAMHPLHDPRKLDGD